MNKSGFTPYAVLVSFGMILTGHVITSIRNENVIVYNFADLIHLSENYIY